MKNSRKKKRSKPSKLPEKASISNGESEEQRVIKSLVEAFSVASLEEAEMAYKAANGDANMAADILSRLSDNTEIDVRTSCSSSTGSLGFGSSSWGSLKDADSATDAVSKTWLYDNAEIHTSCSSSTGSLGYGSSSSSSSKGADSTTDWNPTGSRGKKVVAATGTVSSVLGKDYVTASSRTELGKSKGWDSERVNVEEAEQFLCSMLGDGCELSMAVVRDVLCNCGYDVEKALAVLLDLSAPPQCEPYGNDGVSNFSSGSGEDTNYINSDDIKLWLATERGYDSTSHSSESDVQDNTQLADYCGRKTFGALESKNTKSKNCERNQELELPGEVLESLFHIPRSSKLEPEYMNCKNVVTKMESFAEKQVELGPDTAALNQRTYGKGGEYHVCRDAAKEHWDSMKSFYHKAATAYSNGKKDYAAYLSDKGKLSNKLARDAEEKASMEIFKARNKSIGNVLTIDLHGQHVKQAIRLVKLHLLFGTCISSIQCLRVITGCGTHGLGKSKLKQSVINLLEEEGIEWKEENRGTVLIKLDGPRQFSFQGNDSDSDYE